jgi:hypothetical protein
MSPRRVRDSFWVIFILVNIARYRKYVYLKEMNLYDT